MFGQPYLITQGRPGVETRTAIMYIGQEGLRDFRMGSAAAMSFLLTVALMVISVATFLRLPRAEGALTMAQATTTRPAGTGRRRERSAAAPRPRRGPSGPASTPGCCC